MRENRKIISLSQSNFDIEELKKIIPKDYLVVFFAPVEWMENVGKAVAEAYENSIGTSSYKDINKNNVQYKSVSFLGIKFNHAEFALLKNIDTKIITYYKEIEDLKKIYKDKHSVLLEFTDGLSMAEESVLTVLTNELGDIPVIGASAADDGSFKSTKVCVNGKCKENATALCMLTTPMEIEVYCEYIYKPTKTKAIITDSDLFNRKIHKINGTSAVDFYCNTLGVSKSKIENEFVKHPIARIIGDRYFITSIKDIDNNSFNTYARNFNHSYISICDPIDYKKLWNERSINNKDKYIGGIFIICMFRTNLFESEGSLQDFTKYLASYGEYICMTSYGEQYCDSHTNQSMTACLFKEC